MEGGWEETLRTVSGTSLHEWQQLTLTQALRAVFFFFLMFFFIWTQWGNQSEMPVLHMRESEEANNLFMAK